MRKGWIFFLFLLPSFLFAKPSGAKAVSGQVQLKNPKKNTLEVHTSSNAILEWKDFSIKKGETVHFAQPSKKSSTLNRVLNDVSRIDGHLTSNGSVYLLNPRGILIGKEGVIKTASFIGSTLELENEAFLKDRRLYFRGTSDSMITNLGKIEALDGDIFLFSKTVINRGHLSAPLGTAGIGAAEEILLLTDTEEKIFICPKYTEEKNETGILNEGRISAAIAELKADGNLYRLAINHEGIIDAVATEKRGGKIFLVAEKGTISTKGDLFASAQEGKGGSIHLLGDKVGVLDGAHIDASGDFGGGTLLVGGDYQGKNPAIPNATFTVVEEGASLFANATSQGDGGKIIVWADEATGFYGSAFAEGGLLSGDGGFVEISGKDFLDFHGKVHTLAPQGKTGTLLLDPSNVTIQAGVGMRVNMSFNAGIYTPSGGICLIDPNDIAGTLTWTSAVIQTTSPFNLAGNIIIDATSTINWTTANSLSFVADGSITVNGALTNTSGLGASILMSATAGPILVGYSISSTGCFIETTSGNVSLESGGDILITANNTGGTGNTTVGTTLGALTLSAGGDIILGQIPSPRGPLLSTAASVNVSGASINLTSTGNLLLLAPNVATTTGMVKLVPTGAATSVFNIGESLILQGSTAAHYPVLLGNSAGASTPVNMTFTVGDSVILQGGAETNSYAQIGHIPDFSINTLPSMGDITFTSVGGSVALFGGIVVTPPYMGSTAYAQIGHCNNSSTTGFIGGGDVTFNHIGKDVIVIADQEQALIGHGYLFSPGQDTLSGSIVLNALGDVMIQSGAPSATACAGIGLVSAFTLNTNLSPITSNQVSVSAHSISVYENGQGSSEAFIGGLGIDDPGFIFIDQVNIQTLSSITITSLGGNQSIASASIGTLNFFGSARSTVFIQAGGDLLFVSNAASNGNGLVVNGQLTDNAPPLPITIEAANILIVDSSQPQDAGVFGVFATGTPTLLAQNNIFVGPIGVINGQLEDIILVVDNANPSSPLIGSGSFTLALGGQIFTGDGNTAAGAVRIFTANRALNSIDPSTPINFGIINNPTFTPGPLFINSPTEQWASYYPQSFGGFPFTIFYKNGIPQYQNTYGRALTEMLKSLRVYDEFLFFSKCFLFEYDKACYKSFVYPAGMLSSYDLFNEETERVLQQNYRNYNTKFVQSF